MTAPAQDGPNWPPKPIVIRPRARYNGFISKGAIFCGEILKKGEAAMKFSVLEKGQGLVEYALILVLVAIVVIAALMILGPLVGNVFSTINHSLNSV
jgi:pilus assembly protein Flp/PilA